MLLTCAIVPNTILAAPASSALIDPLEADKISVALDAIVTLPNLAAGTVPELKLLAFKLVILAPVPLIVPQVLRLHKDD